MSVDEMNELWSRVCDTLIKSEAVTDISYETWIKPLKPQGIVGDRFILQIDNAFMRNIVKTRYSDLIRNAIKSITHREYEIDIYLADEEQPAASAESDISDAIERPQLNPKYTFETFVVGNSNKLAHASSVAVAENPAGAYNPLFLYGGVGLGKTHLMHAIGHYMLRENPKIKLMYVTSENFTNELITAIQRNRGNEFREKFRKVDVLMVDDIQFIAGTTSTQEEFFHTFNELHSAGKQIILSSDKPPRNITTLEERLRSRFEWGLIADIQKPDYETRVAILRKKAEAEHIDVDSDIISFIAEKVDSSIRELEGSLTRVVAYSSLSGKPINMDTAQEALINILPIRDPRSITPELITQVVADYYGIAPDELRSSRRSRAIALPRQIAMFLTRDMTDMSLPRIGDAFGGRDHTTVMHACDKIVQLSQTDNSLSRAINDIKKAINEK